MLPVLTYTAPACGARRARLAPRDARGRLRAGARCSGCAGRASRGGRSRARSARATGRPAPPPFTSTPTSRTPCCATYRLTRRPGVRARRRARELLVQTARLWCSLGHLDAAGALPHRRRHRPGRVQRGRRQQRLHEPDGAAQPAARRRTPASAFPHGAERWASTTEENGRWRDAADCDATSPTTRRCEVHPQSDGFTNHEVWDFAATEPDQYPLLLHFPYFDLYRKQVVKQADLVLAMHALRATPSASPAEGAQLRLLRAAHRARLIPVGVHPGRASPSSSAISSWPTHTCARRRLIDLEDLEHNTDDGLHMASLAGIWLASVAGAGGMRQRPRAADVRAAAAERGCSESPSACCSVAAGCRSRSHRPRPAIGCSPGRTSRSPTTAKPSP